LQADLQALSNRLKHPLPLIHRLPRLNKRTKTFNGAGADYPDEIEKENAFHRAGTDFRELLG